MYWYSKKRTTECMQVHPRMHVNVILHKLIMIYCNVLIAPCSTSFQFRCCREGGGGGVKKSFCSIRNRRPKKYSKIFDFFQSARGGGGGQICFAQNTHSNDKMYHTNGQKEISRSLAEIS